MIAFTSVGNGVVTATHRAEFCDAASGIKIADIGADPAGYFSLAVSAKGNPLALGGGGNGRIRLLGQVRLLLLALPPGPPPQGPDLK